MPFDFRAALAAAALALAPQGAAAVSMASSAVSWELRIVSPTPSGTGVEFDSLAEVVVEFADSDGLASSFAEASADPDEVVIDTVDSAIDDAPIASGTSSSEASAERTGFGFAIADTFGSVFLVNLLGLSPVEVSLELAYDISVSASAGDPANEFAFAFGSVSVEVFDEFDSTIFFDDVGEFADAGFGLPGSDLMGTLAFSVTVPAESFVEIDVLGLSDAAAAAVPLPLTAPLLLAALGGLALMRRRA
ncbi:MAG: hypothetical protein AAFR52_12100 [Pseudomonadota bacterium]